MKILVIVVGLIAVAGVAMHFTGMKQSQKVAFVRSALVIERFEGMKEAEQIFNNKIAAWEAEYDTIQKIYMARSDAYEKEKNNLSQAEKQSSENELRDLYGKVMQVKGNIEQKSIAEDEKLTRGALNQINDFVKTYAEQKGYDLVLGVTTTGNILYGTDAIDITEDVITGLNQQY